MDKLAIMGNMGAQQKGAIYQYMFWKGEVSDKSFVNCDVTLTVSKKKIEAYILPCACQDSERSQKEVNKLATSMVRSDSSRNAINI